MGHTKRKGVQKTFVPLKIAWILHFTHRSERMDVGRDDKDYSDTGILHFVPALDNQRSAEYAGCDPKETETNGNGGWRICETS